MKRKAPAKRVPSPRKTPSRSHAPASPSRAMVKSDARKTRSRIKRDYVKSQRALREAREELDAFHSRDLPAFTQWLHRTFGRQLTELRELSAQVAEIEMLIQEVESEAFYEDISYAKAYRRIMRARQRAAQRPSTPEEEKRDDDFEEALEDFFQMFEDLLNAEDQAPPGKKSRHRARPAGPARPTAASSPASRQLKQLYRALVRLLHPDKNARLDPQKQEWWHQVQAAYAEGDTEQLEVILALCEIDQAGHTDSTSMGVLQRIIQQFKKALRDIRSQLRKLKADPAWNFSRRQDRHVVEGQMRWRMETDLDTIKVQLHELNRMVNHWKKGR